MNSPLVIEQAKKLVALPEFTSCSDDAARIDFLYRRIYQRPPRPEEIELGQEFVAEAPRVEKVSAADSALLPVSNQGNPSRPMALGEPFRKRPGIGRKRAPLKSWEEYAHALLQANETSFVN